MANVTISADRDKYYQQIKVSLNSLDQKHKAYLQLFEKFAPLEIFEFVEDYIGLLLHKQEQNVEGVFDTLHSIASSMLSIHLILLGHQRGSQSIPDLVNDISSCGNTNLNMLKDLDFFGKHWMNPEVGDNLLGEPFDIFQALRQLFITIHGSENNWNFKEYYNNTMN